MSRFRVIAIAVALLTVSACRPGAPLSECTKITATATKGTKLIEGFYAQFIEEENNVKGYITSQEGAAETGRRMEQEILPEAVRLPISDSRLREAKTSMISDYQSFVSLMRIAASRPVTFGDLTPYRTRPLEGVRAWMMIEGLCSVQ